MFGKQSNANRHFSNVIETCPYSTLYLDSSIHMNVVLVLFSSRLPLSSARTFTTCQASVPLEI